MSGSVLSLLQILCLPLSLPLPCLHSLSLSLSKINKTLKSFFKDLNIRPETIKLPEENKGKLLDVGLSNDVGRRGLTPHASATKTKIKNRWDYIELKNFCTAEETVNKRKRQPRE